MNDTVYRMVLTGDGHVYEVIVPNPLDEVEQLRAQNRELIHEAEASKGFAGHYQDELVRLRALLVQARDSAQIQIDSALLPAEQFGRKWKGNPLYSTEIVVINTEVCEAIDAALQGQMQACIEHRWVTEVHRVSGVLTGAIRWLPLDESFTGIGVFCAACGAKP